MPKRSCCHTLARLPGPPSGTRLSTICNPAPGPLKLSPRIEMPPCERAFAYHIRNRTSAGRFKSHNVGDQASTGSNICFLDSKAFDTCAGLFADMGLVKISAALRFDIHQRRGSDNNKERSRVASAHPQPTLATFISSLKLCQAGALVFGCGVKAQQGDECGEAENSTMLAGATPVQGCCSHIHRRLYFLKEAVPPSSPFFFFFAPHASCHLVYQGSVSAFRSLP